MRARGASKGSFVHMVLDKLGWGSDGGETGDSVAGAGRFCLCVGDDVSDEDMFLAVKVRCGVLCLRYHALVCVCMWPCALISEDYF